MFNLDVFEYRLDSHAALYGGIPFVMSHGPQTHGMFWNNAAEMFLDIMSADTLMFSPSVTDLVSRMLKNKPTTGVTTHWFADTGVIDIFGFAATDPYSVLDSLTSVTGRPAMPPMFSVGYHQCRWNYKDQKDVKEVL